MISASANAKNILDQNVTLKGNLSCTIEHNMNTLVDGITITGTDYVKADGSKPYKKLFPVDSVLKPSRPVGAGVKYAIAGDIDSGTYHNPSSVEYIINYRTYYPGADTYYKYWLSPKNQGADITITYPQSILTNKIVVRFEISHSVPTSWTIYKENNTQIATGTNSDIKSFYTNSNKNYDAGTLTLYYNGSSWTTTQPSTIYPPTSITGLKLTTSGVSDAYVGVIELSPRLVYDVSDKLVNFGISKESSSSPDDLVPVGKVTANSFSAELTSYEDDRVIKSYERGDAFDATKVYLYKYAEIKPYYKLYYSGAPLSDSNGQYEKIPQGTFFLNNWTTGEFGDISITALDGANYLQRTLAPNLFCQEFSVVAILRRLLDSIGFTNYNFNVKKDNTDKITDTSIFSPKYWWTDDSKPVWDAIQELCRDSQMVACFDEYNVLQFYTRDYIFNPSRSVDWQFRYSKSGQSLPNIISMDKQDISTANKIKVLWRTLSSSELIPGNAGNLWKSETSFMGAFSLDQNVYSNSTYLNVSPVVVNQKETEVIYSYTGYLVIDSEIIEYDAIEFQYLSRAEGVKKLDVTNVTDLQKIYNDIQPSTDPNAQLKQTGRLRIKTRGAFGTTISNHYANAQDILSSWDGLDVTWTAV